MIVGIHQCNYLPSKAFFDKMKHDKVYYIQPRSYYHGLSYLIIMDRFVKSNVCKELIQLNGFLEFMYNWFKMKATKSFDSTKTKEEYEADLVIQQKIMYNIKEFFYMSTRNTYTKKIRSYIGKYTRSKRSGYNR